MKLFAQSTNGVRFLLAALLLAWSIAVQASSVDRHPLAPPDRSSPRATLLSFIEHEEAVRNAAATDVAKRLDFDDALLNKVVVGGCGSLHLLRIRQEAVLLARRALRAAFDGAHEEVERIVNRLQPRAHFFLQRAGQEADGAAADHGDRRAQPSGQQQTLERDRADAAFLAASAMVARDVATALETAYLHRQALEKERLEREIDLKAYLAKRRGSAEIAAEGVNESHDDAEVVSEADQTRLRLQVLQFIQAVARSEMERQLTSREFLAVDSLRASQVFNETYSHFVGEQATRLTLEMLGKRSGLTPNYIGTVEGGKRDPSITTLKAIAEGLMIPLSALFGEEPKLGPDAVEMATLCQEMSPEGQEALLTLLRTVVRRRGR